MPWEQLELPELDGRVMLVAGYLADKLDGMCVVDLNCGTAPLLDWLPPKWEMYYGNDTNEDFITQCLEKGAPRTKFSAIADDEALDEIDEVVDILICLGYGARYHPLESSTVDETIVDVVVWDRPHIIALDAWWDITKIPACGFDALVGKLRSLGYRIAHDLNIEENRATTAYSKRRVVILEAE